MAQLAFIVGTFWLIAAFWIDSGGSEEVLWASVLPAAWLVSLPYLKS